MIATKISMSIVTPASAIAMKVGLGIGSSACDLITKAWTLSMKAWCCLSSSELRWSCIPSKCQAGRRTVKVATQRTDLADLLMCALRKFSVFFTSPWFPLRC